MFHHIYIALGKGRQSIGDKILMTTERPFLFAHMLQVSKLEFVFYVKTDVSPLLEWCSFVQSQVLVQQRGINSESK